MYHNSTPNLSEKVNRLFEQLKNEFLHSESDLGVLKIQRDEYKRKFEGQINEFNSMRQTIYDLDMNFQNMKSHYEQELTNLRRQIDSSKNNISNPPNQSMNKQQSLKLGPTKMKNILRQDAFPSITSGPPIKRLRTENGSESFYKSSTDHLTDKSKENNNNIPSFHQILEGKKKVDNKIVISKLPSISTTISSSKSVNENNITLNSLDKDGGGSGGNNSNDLVSTQNGQSSSSLINGSGVGMGNGIGGIVGGTSVGVVGITEPSGNGGGIQQEDEHKVVEENSVVKKEGNDWVVVYNPQVKTNVNIKLGQNIKHSSVVCCVKFSNDGKYLATGCNKSAYIYSVETGKMIRKLPPLLKNNQNGEKDSYVRSVCFSPDGKYLVAGAEDKTVKVWNIKSGIQKRSLVGHKLDIYSLDFSSDNRIIVSGSGDGRAKLWNLESGKCLHTLGNEEDGPKEGVTSVAISADGSMVAAGSLDCIVRLWDTKTGQFLCSFKGHDDSVYSVAFSPDGKTLASGSLDKTLKLWDLSGNRQGDCIATLTGHRDYVLSVAFSPDGKWLISGSKDRSVQFWEPRSYVLHLMLQGHKNSVISVALNPKSKTFATGSGDCRARIWQYDSNNTTSSL